MATHCQVLYTFAAEDEGELSVSAGDIVTVNAGEDGIFGTDDDTKDDWVLVEANGTSGYVPANYLKQQQPGPEPAPAPAPAPLVAPLVVPSPAHTTASTFTPAQSMPGFPSAPIRRLSDPRLAQHLLETIDPKTVGGGVAGNKSPLRSPVTSTLASTVTPGGAGTAGAKRSVGAAAAWAKVKSNTPNASANNSAKLFSSVRTMMSGTMTSTQRTPALSAAVAAEDYGEMFRRNEDYFLQLQASRADTFSTLSEMVDALATRVNDNTEANGTVMGRIGELDALIDEERRKWKQKIETDKSSSASNLTAEAK
jgi:hypothetical protein